MHSSRSAFAPGLGLGGAVPVAFKASGPAPRPAFESARPAFESSVLTSPTGNIRPVVFGQLGAAINASPVEPDEPVVDQVAETPEAVEPEPAPPPIDYEAIK